MKIYTKESLIEKLKEVRAMGWIESRRHGNVGAVGNTLEDILEIPENNLPIPNAAEWELKCQRLKKNAKASSMTTLFHMEPSPQALKFVPSILLPKYGWKHKGAGERHPENEMSFRQTIGAVKRSDRGFGVVIDHEDKKVLISFDGSKVHTRHLEWLKSVETRIGLGELNPQPYWGYADLFHKAGTKLLNCFLVGAFCERREGKEFFKYDKILMLSNFALPRFIQAIEMGDILIDFDARTGHNHGTKFRFKQSRLFELYDNVTEI